MTPIPPAQRRFWLPWSVAVFAIAAVLLFAALGHYPLWSDEADTALFARGIARTGDLSAVLDQNVYAYRFGSCLKNLRGRYQPPVPYYLAAPFVGVENTNAFWPRFPFAICGLLSVGLILYWMGRSQLPALWWVVFSLGLLANVSFFLYCRQCRYYALAMLLSLTIAYLYLHGNGRWWQLAAMTVASILLLGTQYLAYAGLYAALAVDYLLFRRREQRLTVDQWIVLLTPQAIAGILAAVYFNPFGAEVVQDTPQHNLLVEKLILLWWNLRDLNHAEFGVGLLMAAAPLLYLIDKNRWLLRLPVAIVSFVLIVTIFSPQPLVDPWYGDVRYLCTLIPVCVALTTLSIVSVSRYRWAPALTLAAIAFGTNILHQPLDPTSWRSTPYQWINELRSGRTTPAQEAIDWINQHVKPGQSIEVLPGYMIYPLMYHAPQALYAWQLKPPPQGQFKDLPPIHFQGLEPPDYIMAFGRKKGQDKFSSIYNEKRVDYTRVARLDIFWDELTRPELFLRSFKPITGYDPKTQAVYIWQRDAGANEVR